MFEVPFRPICEYRMFTDKALKLIPCWTVGLSVGLGFKVNINTHFPLEINYNNIFNIKSLLSALYLYYNLLIQHFVI